MFTDRDVVCISPIAWNFHRQRHQLFIAEIARAGNRITYIEGMQPSARPDGLFLNKAFRRIARCGRAARPAENASVIPITPMIIPGSGAFASLLNKKFFLPALRRRLAAAGVRKPVVWTYLATRQVADFIASLEPAALVYDTVFDARLHPDSPSDIARSEDNLIAKADLVLTDNHYLFDRCAPLNGNTRIIPPGVDYALYSADTTAAAAVPFDGLPRPRLCFFGGVTDLHIDVPLIASVARRRPDWNIVFFGTMVKIDPRALALSNIRLYPATAPENIPAYLRAVDVILIPNRMNEFSLSIFPAKTYECLASGKPIIAADIPELRAFDQKLIRRGNGPEDFIRLIEDALANDTPELKQRRKELARGNDWKTRYAELDNALSTLFKTNTGNTP